MIKNIILFFLLLSPVFAVPTCGPGQASIEYIGTYVRAVGATYVRYYHMPLFSANPGASGATFSSADANTLTGWQLNAVGETLNFQADVHNDWDGVSDLKVEVHFSLLASGTANDTVDLKLVCYYKGTGDTATKTQTVEVPTTTDGTRYKNYSVTFTIDYDAVSNVVDKGDIICFILNLETDTSEIDDVKITDASFYYATNHAGIEDGDM